MQTSYVAYGMRLSSDFSLPGMPARVDPELPSLALRLCAPERMTSTWSGSPAEPTWRGRLGDGLDLTIEHGVEGDVLFSYGDRARFRLLADETGLDCAPEQAGADWLRALIGKVLPTIALMKGYEALHAAVVDSPQGAVAIAAPSGAGKSTLALELLRRGWSLFADDVLVLDRVEGGVRAHPGTPHMNLDLNLPDSIDASTIGETLGFLSGERWLAAHRTVDRPRPVRMVCLLERGPGLDLELEPLGPKPLLLAPYMLNLTADAERERERFCLYADLVDSASLTRLTAGSRHAPAQLGDLIEATLAQASLPLMEEVG